MSAQLPHRPRAWLFGVVVPLLVHLIGALVVLAAWPRLPEEVVVHVGPGGARHGSPEELVAYLAALGGVSYLLLAALSLTVGRTAMNRRLVLGIATGFAVLVVGLLLGLLLPQAGGQPLAVDLPLAVAVTLALGAGAVAAACGGTDPLLPSSEPVPDAAPRAGDADTVWQRRVMASRGMRRWGAVLGAVYVVGAVALGLAAVSWFVPVLLIVPATMAGATGFAWDVRVDRSGLTARCALGWPRQHVPASEVVRADVTEVDPFGQFGGWGLRTSADGFGTVGVVVRKGEAIAVERTGGRQLVVTVDDALGGASLLNTMADLGREDIATTDTDGRAARGSHR